MDPLLPHKNSLTTLSHKLKDSTSIIFAIIDRTGAPSIPGLDGALAGIVGYLNSEPMNLPTEIRSVFVLPPFQKTRVASTAVGLMLQFALEPMEKGGLGLRTVQWQIKSLNTASRRLAEKVGFRFEGILRWQRVFHEGRGKGRLKMVRSYRKTATIWEGTPPSSGYVGTIGGKGNEIAYNIFSLGNMRA